MVLACITSAFVSIMLIPPSKRAQFPRPPRPIRARKGNEPYSSTKRVPKTPFWNTRANKMSEISLSQITSKLPPPGQKILSQKSVKPFLARMENLSFWTTTRRDSDRSRHHSHHSLGLAYVKGRIRYRAERIFHTY